MFSNQAAKIDKIFTTNLTVTTQRQIDGEDVAKFCGLLRKDKLQLTGEKFPEKSIARQFTSVPEQDTQQKKLQTNLRGTVNFSKMRDNSERGKKQTLLSSIFSVGTEIDYDFFCLMSKNQYDSYLRKLLLKFVCTKEEPSLKVSFSLHDSAQK